MREYKEISIDQIDVPSERMRKSFEDAGLEELSQSIREHGVLEPVILRRENERYKVVAGVRRVWACRMCGKVMVPSVILDVEEKNVLAIEMVENVMRENLNAMDEAFGIGVLVRSVEGDVEKVAKMLRKSEDYIRGRLAMLDWPGEVMNAVEGGLIGVSVARELVKCEDKDVGLGFLEAAVKGGCTARTMAGWVSDWRVSQGEDISRSAAQIIQDHTSPPPAVVVKCSGCGQEIQDGDLRTLILCSGCYEALKKEMEKE